MNVLPHTWCVTYIQYECAPHTWCVTYIQYDCVPPHVVCNLHTV